MGRYAAEELPTRDRSSRSFSLFKHFFLVYLCPPPSHLIIVRWAHDCLHCTEADTPIEREGPAVFISSALSYMLISSYMKIDSD